MTREEEIKQASMDFSYDATGGHLYRDLECGFRNGAQWADAHPINPWHKASEELPKVPEKKKYVKVLTTLRHGSGYDFRILYFHKDFGFSTHKEYQNAYYKDRKTGCVHWMYIPEIKED